MTTSETSGIDASPAQNGERCIRAVTERDDEDNETLVIDAIADIMHFCHRDGIDFECCRCVAADHFEAEMQCGCSLCPL